MPMPCPPLLFLIKVCFQQQELVSGYTMGIHRAFVMGAGFSGILQLSPKALDIFWWGNAVFGSLACV
jgi:hypothetical protein